MRRKAACRRVGAAALAVVLGIWALNTPAQQIEEPLNVPDLLVYEGFDYEGVNVSLNGQDGGFGFDEAWDVGGWNQAWQTGRTNFNLGDGTTVNEHGGLEFPGLPTVGSALTRFGPAGQRWAERSISAEELADLTQDDTTIWFSILLGATAQGNARRATFIFGDNGMVEGGGMDGPGHGFGVGLRTDDDGSSGDGTGSPNAVAFINSESATVDVATFTPVLQDGGTHFDTMLVVGKINWKPEGTPDELYIFNISDVTENEPEEAEAVASLTADFDQSTFDRIALWDTGQSILDEIRMGRTYDSVLSRPAPPATRIILY